MEIEIIYYDLSTDKAYRSNKTEIANDNIPQFRYKSKKQIQWQFLNTATITNGVFSDVYTGLSATTVVATSSIDNNSVHFYDGHPNATITKAVSAATIVIKELEGVPRICGRLKLTNAAGETETINYNGFTVSGTNYTFTLADASYVVGAQTPTYTYLTTDTCRVLEIPIVKDPTVDVTAKATGLFTTTLDCFKLVYQDLIEGEDEISGCKHEIIIKDTTPENILVKQIPVKCLGIQDDDGDVGPAPADNYPTWSELNALLAVLQPVHSFSSSGSFKTEQDNVIFVVPSGKLFKPTWTNLLCTAITGPATLPTFTFKADTAPLFTARVSENTGTVNGSDSDDLGGNTWYTAGTIFYWSITSGGTSTTHTGKGLIEGKMIDA